MSLYPPASLLTIGAGGTFAKIPRGCDNLITRLIELGAGATWSDFEAWRSATGVEVNRWEAITMLRLSRAMKSFLENPDLESPWPEKLSGPEVKAKFLAMMGR